MAPGFCIPLVNCIHTYKRNPTDIETPTPEPDGPQYKSPTARVSLSRMPVPRLFVLSSPQGKTGCTLKIYCYLKCSITRPCLYSWTYLHQKMHIVSTYTARIRIPYKCFGRYFSSSGVSSKSSKEFRIHPHVCDVFNMWMDANFLCNFAWTPDGEKTCRNICRGL
jgi:hypothetical protein